MQRSFLSFSKHPTIKICLALLLMSLLAACSNSTGSTNNSRSSATKSTVNDSPMNPSANVAADIMTSDSQQLVLGPQSCPASASAPTHWDPIVGTQTGVSTVSRVTCANLVGKPTLQALVLVSYDGASGVKDAYVYDNITSPSPTQIFKLQNLIQGDAKISGYNTVLTAEVDQNSHDNSGKAPVQQHPDLFREFKWSNGAGTLIQVPFPGLFPVLTRYQADVDQQQVNQGHQPWQLSASMTAQALAANLLKWAPDSPATIVQGGGQQDVDAVVDVKNNRSEGTIRVTMSRLYGNRNGGVWIATNVATPGWSITSPAAYDRLSSPANVAGMGKALNGKTGVVRILDHTEADIGHADVQLGGTNFTVAVSYTTTFKTGSQEGIVALYLDGGAVGAVMVKVLLG